jgi:hypothetical protein
LVVTGLAVVVLAAVTAFVAGLVTAAGFTAVLLTLAAPRVVVVLQPGVFTGLLCAYTHAAARHRSAQTISLRDMVLLIEAMVGTGLRDVRCGIWPTQQTRVRRSIGRFLAQYMQNCYCMEGPDHQKRLWPIKKRTIPQAPVG